MNIGPFATPEEAIKWGQEFVTAIEKGFNLFAEQEAGQVAAEELDAETYTQSEYVISQLDQLNAVIATTKHTLSELIPKLRNIKDVDHTHTQPLTAAVFTLDWLERELDDINLFLVPTDKIYEAAREMAASANIPSKMI